MVMSFGLSYVGEEMVTKLQFLALKAAKPQGHHELCWTRCLIRALEKLSFPPLLPHCLMPANKSHSLLNPVGFYFAQLPA